MKTLSLILLSGLFILGCNDSTAQEPGTDSNQKAGSVQNGTRQAPAKDEKMNLETATFAGGCFWCTEAVFLALEGVDSVLPGYMGGLVDNPTYEQVCTGNTGHAEVIQIKFDPEKISFDELLYVFFKTHDPTTLNRQGNDRGTQYRSAVFFHDEKQKTSAEEIKKKIDESDLYRDPVVTEITQASKMYVAEDYHINYFAKNPNNSYCRAFIPGKIEKLKKLFGDKLKSQFKN
jgi:peptide-methionine (S)-S-oxide reductase